MNSQTLISPTEPRWLKAIGKSSSVPERYGADILLLPHRAGIQRKEFGDLVTSLHDGRLQKEVAQLARLPYSVLIVEGRIVWGSPFMRFTRKQFFGLLLSIQNRGVWVVQTEDQYGTLEAVEEMQRWFSKNSHDGLDRRPKERTVWGKPDAADSQAWVLQGVPGISATLARRIIETYPRPIQWAIGADDLQKIPGIGKAKAAAFHGALNGA